MFLYIVNQKSLSNVEMAITSNTQVEDALFSMTLKLVTSDKLLSYFQIRPINRVLQCRAKFQNLKSRELNVAHSVHVTLKFL